MQHINSTSRSNIISSLMDSLKELLWELTLGERSEDGHENLLNSFNCGPQILWVS